jgi:hypothetical protein
LLAGLLRDEQRKILTGFPGITKTPILRALFGSTNDEINQSDIVMLLTPHIVRTHELTVEDLSTIYIGTQQNVGLGGPPPLIAPQPGPDNPPPPTLPAATPPAGGTQPGTVPGVPRSTANPEGGVPPTNFPAPPGTSPVPSLVTPLPPPATAPAAGPPTATPPGGAPAPTPTPGAAPAATPPAGGAVPTTPPRDVAATPPGAPTAAPAGAAAAQVIVTPPGTEFRVAGGPYTVPISINNVSRLSVMTLTVTYNPNVLRVRTAQDGTFMRQGGVATSFTPRIDAATGRVDIAITRTADQAGASGAGLLTALIFDAIGQGGSVIQVSGVASTPEGTAINLQFNPVNVTVR